MITLLKGKGTFFFFFSFSFFCRTAGVILLTSIWFSTLSGKWELKDLTLCAEDLGHESTHRFNTNIHRSHSMLVPSWVSNSYSHYSQNISTSVHQVISFTAREFLPKILQNLFLSNLLQLVNFCTQPKLIQTGNQPEFVIKLFLY